MPEGVVAQENAGSAAALEYSSSLELRDRLLDREFWTRIAFVGLVGVWTGLLLATDINRPVRLVGVTAVVTTVWVLSLWRAGTLTPQRGLEPILASCAGAVVGLGAISILNVWLLEPPIPPSKLLLMAVSVVALAATFQVVASRTLAPRRRVAAVGFDDGVRDVIASLETDRDAGFDFLGLAVDDVNGSKLRDVRVLGRSGDVVEIVRREHPHVIVCSTPRVRNLTVDRLLDAGVTSVRVVEASEFSEFAFHRVAGRAIRPSWFAGVLDIDAGHYSGRAKRAFDVVFAGAALLATAPLIGLIALAVRLSDGGPVFYRQVRSGERGIPFQMVKFRTMVQDAEHQGAVWAAENDPRVTRVGRVLRKTRLDELPQFWNVLRGEMSIVGPRPERPEYLEALLQEIPFWGRRHLLKPGITGWAQVHLAYTHDISGAASKLAYDLYYLKHRSLALDLLILLKTVKVVLTGHGAR